MLTVARPIGSNEYLVYFLAMAFMAESNQRYRFKSVMRMTGIMDRPDFLNGLLRGDPKKSHDTGSSFDECCACDLLLALTYINSLSAQPLGSPVGYAKNPSLKRLTLTFQTNTLRGCPQEGASFIYAY
jgi:hypothetical protein